MNEVHCTSVICLQCQCNLCGYSDCSFLSKCVSVRDAGAVAVIIRDNDVENSQFMIDMIDDGTGRPVDIAAFFMLGKDGCVGLCQNECNISSKRFFHDLIASSF